MDRSASASERSSYIPISESSQIVPSISAHLRNCFLQLLRLGFRILSLFFEADMFLFFLGQVLADIRHHSFEFLVSLFTLLVICLQRVMVGEVVRVFLVEVFEISSSPSLC